MAEMKNKVEVIKSVSVDYGGLSMRASTKTWSNIGSEAVAKTASAVISPNDVVGPDEIKLKDLFTQDGIIYSIIPPLSDAEVYLDIFKDIISNLY